MANPGAPKRKKKITGKEEPPALDKPSNNLDKPSNNSYQDLNFKVEPEFKKEFKGYAVDNDMTMVNLLKECFDFYRKNN